MQELQEIKATKFLSFRWLYNKLKNKKFAGKLHFTDFERGENMAKFKDFGISEDGRFVAVGSKGVLLKMNNLKDIFPSIRGLSGDITSGKIPLCLTKDGEWYENVMAADIPEIERHGDKLHYQKARKRPIYEIIAEKNSEISSLQGDLEEKEELVQDLQSKLDDVERGLRLQESDAETMRAEVSESEKSSTNVGRAFNSLTKRLDQKTNRISILEDELEKLTNQLDKMIKEAEREGVKLSDDKALESIKNIRRELVRDEPQVKIVEVPKLLPNVSETTIKEVKN